jgi:hypothetical protein
LSEIRYSVSHDWNGDPAILFWVLLSDNASRAEVLAGVTGRISGKLFDRLGDSDYTPYFYFRCKSEQDKLQDPEWQSMTIS